jgi:hypothetical protein
VRNGSSALSVLLFDCLEHIMNEAHSTSAGIGTMDTVDWSVKREANGQFPPGVSGNPAGRPRGSRNRATLLASQLREGEAELVARIVIEAALAGDMRMAKFLLERIFSRPKSRTIVLDLPDGDSAAAAAGCLDAILAAVTAGEITIDEGERMARLVAQRDRYRAADQESAPEQTATAQPETAQDAPSAAAEPPRPMNRAERRRVEALRRRMAGREPARPAQAAPGLRLNPPCISALAEVAGAAGPGA